MTGGTMVNKYNDEEVTGTYSWENGDEILTERGSYIRKYVIFTPDDQVSYKPTRFGTTVTITCSHEDSDFVDTGTVYTEATCTATGREQQKCPYCGITTRATTPALGHDYTWEYDDTRHWEKCSRCDNTENPANHVFSGRRCETCGYEKPQAITVTITWSEMAFTYTDGLWDPETHNYSEGQWAANDPDGDRITVENAGDAEVSVEFIYTMAEGSTVGGSFMSSEKAAMESPVALAAGEKKYAWLRLTGKPEHDMQDETVGTVTVRLGGTI